MIWSKKFFAEIDIENQRVLKAYQYKKQPKGNVLRVGIVGGGPKGIYAIERLASLWSKSVGTENLEITCFNTDDSFGAGNNYNSDQPDYLLINYSLGNINFWIDEPIQLVQERLDFLDFINEYKVGTDEVAHPLDFCSRALTGIYLQYCLIKVLESLPANIQVCLRTEKIVDLIKNNQTYELVTEQATYKEGFAEILFCTGHAYQFTDRQTKTYSNFSDSNLQSYFVPHIYPIEKISNSSFTSKNVLVQGMGLTFVDAVLVLTEGLGGKFESKDDRFVYHPSGREPKAIFPFSRTGLPMLARKPGLSENLDLKYFNQGFVDKLFNKYVQVNFEKEVLPVVIKEYRHQFVMMFLQIVGYSCQFEKKMLDLDALEKLVSIIFPEFKPFDFWNFIEPKNENSNQHAYVLGYLENSIFPGSRPIQQALCAMNGIWRGIHPLFNKLYRFGKLTGESQEKFDSYYFGRFSRVSYGPPLHNMKKILALAEAGILNFIISKNPQIDTNCQTGLYEVPCQEGDGFIQAEVLIDARIARATELESLPEVYQRIIRKYDVGFYKNDAYQLACLNLDKEANVNKLPGITLNGTPTEGWTLDNESLSRKNNNFISPWANRIVNKYVTKTSKVKTLSSQLG